MAANDAEGQEAIKTVKKMIFAVRANRNDKALSYVGLEAMSKYLLDENYSKLEPAQQTKFQSLLGEYIALRAFPMARQYIGDVGLSYGKPRMEGDKVHVESSVVYAGSERVQFTWVLSKINGEYLVTDFISAGGSSMEANRDKQVLPMYKQYGAKGLLSRMEGLVKRLKAGS